MPSLLNDHLFKTRYTTMPQGALLQVGSFADEDQAFYFSIANTDLSVENMLLI
ncbi:hypothetical protein [Bacillus sp. MUM 116]|uniref:hypothetical protein n=1 Tax=Bacillus sp. MUM 116 TaxID=1678002 RepID=UPI0015A50A3C|nr:hypothetical protein [Bacillus sp. MUM 116]